MTNFFVFLFFKIILPKPLSSVIFRNNRLFFFNFVFVSPPFFFLRFLFIFLHFIHSTASRYVSYFIFIFFLSFQMNQLIYTCNIFGSLEMQNVYLNKVKLLLTCIYFLYFNKRNYNNLIELYEVYMKFEFNIFDIK